MISKRHTAILSVALVLFVIPVLGLLIYKIIPKTPRPLLLESIVVAAIIPFSYLFRLLFNLLPLKQSALFMYTSGGIVFLAITTLYIATMYYSIRLFICAKRKPTVFITVLICLCCITIIAKHSVEAAVKKATEITRPIIHWRFWFFNVEIFRSRGTGFPYIGYSLYCGGDAFDDCCEFYFNLFSDLKFTDPPNAIKLITRHGKKYTPEKQREMRRRQKIESMEWKLELYLKGEMEKNKKWFSIPVPSILPELIIRKLTPEEKSKLMDEIFMYIRMKNQVTDEDQIEILLLLNLYSLVKKPELEAWCYE